MIEFRPVDDDNIEIHATNKDGSSYFGDLVTHGGKWVLSASSLHMTLSKQYMDWDKDIEEIQAKMANLNKERLTQSNH